MSDTVLGYLRDILKLGGAALVSRGLIDADGVQQAIGALVTLIGIGWSAWRRWKRAENKTPETKPPTP